MPNDLTFDDHIKNAKHHGKIQLHSTIDDQAGWEWRLTISVLPTSQNIKKAYHVLCDNAELTQRKHPLDIQLLVPHTDPADIVNSDLCGKEISIKLHTIIRDAKVHFAYTPDEYKTIIMQLWKALEDAHVELSYIPPYRDQSELTCEQGIVAPFAYGVADTTGFNPQQYADPLQGIHITLADLKQYGIKHYSNDDIRKYRQQYLAEHLQSAVKAIQGELLELNNSETTSLNYESMSHAVEDLDHDFIRQHLGQFDLPSLMAAHPETMPDLLKRLQHLNHNAYRMKNEASKILYPIDKAIDLLTTYANRHSRNTDLIEHLSGLRLHLAMHINTALEEGEKTQQPVFTDAKHIADQHYIMVKTILDPALSNKGKYEAVDQCYMQTIQSPWSKQHVGKICLLIAVSALSV